MGASRAVAERGEFGTRPLDQPFQVVLGLAGEFEVGVACDLAGGEQDREHGALVFEVNGDGLGVAASAGRKRRAAWKACEYCLDSWTRGRSG